MSIRTHEDVNQQLQDLLSTVKALVPELSFLKLKVYQDEDDPDVEAKTGNNMYISHGKIVSCNTVGEVTYQPVKTKDRFLHECGHALFRCTGEKQGLLPITWPDDGGQDLDRDAYESDYMIKEMGAEVFAHLSFSKSLNYGEARGIDLVHHFYNSAITSLQILCEMKEPFTQSQVVEQALAWARIAFKYYLKAPCRPSIVYLEDHLRVFIQGEVMVFPDDWYLHQWEES